MGERLGKDGLDMSAAGVSAADTAGSSDTQPPLGDTQPSSEQDPTARVGRIDAIRGEGKPWGDAVGRALLGSLRDQRLA
ncbi:MAG: hypothetical protein AAB971_01165 [Patescibacteria group bacterium]